MPIIMACCQVDWQVIDENAHDDVIYLLICLDNLKN